MALSERSRIVGVMYTRLSVVLLLVSCQNQGANVAANRTNAEKWVADTLPGYQLSGFSSATLDSDGDGYVTVDITVEKDGVLRLLQLGCPTAGQMMELQVGHGCKYEGSPLDNRY